MERLVLVGGHGQMGRMFQRFLAPSFELQILDRDNRGQAAALLGRADYAIVTVPMQQTCEVIAEVAPLLRADAVLADFCSIKTPPVQAMLQHHAGPVLGLHPMFGPGADRLAGQTIVVCAGRAMERAQTLIAALHNAQAQLVYCSAEEHDQMMTVVQAVRHFVTFSLGSFLASENIDVTRSLQFASPVYRLEIDMVSRLLAQDAALYADIMLATPERRLMINKLAEHYAQLATLVADNDRDGLLQRFTHAKESFAQEAQRAMKESNVVIGALASHLAQQNED